MAVPRNSRRSGGPRTPAGKRAAAGNAMKCGIASTRWFDAGEQAQFEQLLAALQQEYPGAPLRVAMQLQLLATSWVKLARLESIDNAQQEIARALAQEVSELLQPAAAASRGATPGNTPDATANAAPGETQGQGAGPPAAVLALRRQAALPGPERMDNLERYRMGLQRHIVRLLAEIDEAYQGPKARRTAGAPMPAAAPSDISDAAVLPAPAAH